MKRAKANKDDSRTAKGKSAVDKLVLATVNAPYKRAISVRVLKECLVKGDPGNWPVHLASFFTDVSPSLVFGFADLHGISRSKLARAYRAIKVKTGEVNPDLEAQLVSVAKVA
jgi:hypothetical protein